MIDDLAFAKSALDWAETQIPSFKERLQGRANENIHIASVDFENNPSQSMLVAREREPIPLSFSVEFGAYLNVIQKFPGYSRLRHRRKARHNTDG
jgi:hypothetical protein